MGMSWLDRRLGLRVRWPRVRARPPRHGARPIGVQVGDAPNPYSQEGTLARKQRNDAAASLVEDDTYAYLVVRLAKDDDHSSGRITLAGHIRPQWRPAFKVVLERIARSGVIDNP